MFGENLTVTDFDEKKIFVGDIYKVGDALVQVSQSREPCYKLGYKFGTPLILKQFIKHGFSGTYMSILQEGKVNVNDEFFLVERPKSSLTVYELFNLLFAKEKNQNLLKIATESEAIPLKKRVFFKSYIK